MLQINKSMYKKHITKFIVIIILFLFSNLANAQTRSKLFYSFGSGISLLGHGDLLTLNFENELTYQIGNMFYSSISLNIGRSPFSYFVGTSSFLQGNMNLFIAPWGVQRKNIFKLGFGLTTYYISESPVIRRHYIDGKVVSIEYGFEKRRSTGFNLIIEDMYSITKKHQIGLKLFIQKYANGDINTGTLVRFGILLI